MAVCLGLQLLSRRRAQRRQRAASKISESAMFGGWRWLVVVPRAVVVFNLVTNFMEATIRQFGFMLRGLEHGEEQHQAPPLLLQSMRFWCFSVVRVALGGALPVPSPYVAVTSVEILQAAAAATNDFMFM